MDLTLLTPLGRKQWTKRKWDDYIETQVYESIIESIIEYEHPDDDQMKDRIDRAKWATAIDRRVDYLFARPPAAEHEGFERLIPFFKKSAKQYLLRGSLIWIVQGDGERLKPQPHISSNTIAIYADEEQTEVVAYIRRYVKIEITPETGEEDEIEFFECFYDGKKDTYCFEDGYEDIVGENLDSHTFIQLGKTGTSPLYSRAKNILLAFDKVMKYQDKVIEENTSPIIEVRGYSGTSDEDLEYAVNTLKIVKTEGTGGIQVHGRVMDTEAVSSWEKRLLQEFYETTSTTGKENEVAMAQSGKALDRLFLDMDNKSNALAQVIEEAIRAYFTFIEEPIEDIIWNLDRPTNDTEIITSIQQSRGLISDETLVELHPWIDNPEQEKERIKKQQLHGMEDLDDPYNLF